MNSALFFVHKGNQDYFNVCLRFARRNNPCLPFVVINNTRVDFDDDNTTWLSFDEFASPIDKTYVHLSPNSRQFELLCLSRWFYILEAMERLGIERAGHVDSDVLLGDVGDRLESNEYEFTFDSGHVSFFRQDQLSSLCSHIEDSYANEIGQNRLRKIYELRKKDGLLGGISDMTLIREFALEKSVSAQDLSRMINNQVFDHNINLSDGFFLMHEGRKAVVTNGDKLAFIDATTFLPIEARAIHFQGAAKQFMAAVAELPVGNCNLFSYSTKSWAPFVGTVNSSPSLMMRARELRYRISKKLKSIQSLNSGR